MDIWELASQIWGLLACMAGVLTFIGLLIIGTTAIIALVKLCVQKIEETDLHG